MKCVTYRRVSTDMQREEGYSLEAQRERLRNYIQSQGWELVEEYADEGVSAKNIDRPDLQRLLSDMKTGKFEVVLVYRLDRLVRSVTDLHYLLSEFDRYNVSFKSATEVFDTTSAMGRLFITIVGAMAAWERENLGERVVMGMSRKAFEGGRLGGVPPWGYDSDGNGNLIINKEEAKWVRFVFESYRKKGLRGICIDLNKEGVMGKKGKGWVPSTLEYLISNPVYIGTLRWSNTGKGDVVTFEDAHEPIIDKKLFDEAQRIRKERSAKKQKPKSPYIFSGLLMCGNCGRRLIGGKYKYKGVSKNIYRCSPDNAEACGMPLFSESLLVDWFLSHDFIKDIKLSVKDLPIQDETEDTTSLKKELKKLHISLQRNKDLYRSLEIDKKEYNEFKKEAQNKINEITFKIDSQSLPVVNIDELQNHFNNLQKKWDTHSLETKKAGISRVIKDIIVKVNKKGTVNTPAEIEIIDYEWAD